MQERKTLSLKKSVQVPTVKDLQPNATHATTPIPMKSEGDLQTEKQKAQLKKEREDKKAAIELLKKKKHEILEKLLHDYPNCFSKDSPKPLKVGIGKEIAPTLEKVQVKYLSPCLHTYVNSKKYHQAMIANSHRIDLMGKPVEEISEEHREHARQTLAVIAEKQKQRNK